MPDLTISFEVYCSCGNGICNNASTRTSRNRGEQQLVVEPCEKCLETARYEGAEEKGKEVRAEMETEIENLKGELSAVNERIE